MKKRISLFLFISTLVTMLSLGIIADALSISTAFVVGRFIGISGTIIATIFFKTKTNY